MSTSIAAPRRKRFDRLETTPEIIVDERKLRILAFIARFRFVDRHQIAAMDGGSAQKVRRILRQLYDARLVERPRSQITNIWTDAYKPIVYSLDERGAELLSERYGMPLKSLNAQLKANRLSAKFIDHTVETAEHMLAFMMAGHERGLQTIDHRDLAASFPSATRGSKRPFALPLDFDGARQHVEPDRLFALVDPNGQRFNFALELDRGTMPVERSFDTASSFGAKLPLYLAAFVANLHTARWGFKRLRVLTVTPSEARLEHIIKVAGALELSGENGKAIKSPPGLFLFTTPDRLREASPLDAVWSNINGIRVALP